METRLKHKDSDGVRISRRSFLIWKEDVSVYIKSFSHGHIDSVVDIDDDSLFRVRVFYGNLDSG